MVHVTQQAKEALVLTRRRASIADPTVGLRLAFGHDGSLGLVQDRAKAGDHVVKHDDATVLLVDPEISALTVTGRVIDYLPGSDGRMQFVLRRITDAERRSFWAA
jgi:hypothetical protein